MGRHGRIIPGDGLVVSARLKELDAEWPLRLVRVVCGNHPCAQPLGDATDESVLGDFRGGGGNLDLPLGWTLTPPEHFVYQGTGEPAWTLNDLRRLPPRRAGDGRRRPVKLDWEGHRRARRPRRVGPRDGDAHLDPLALLATGPVPGVVSLDTAEELAGTAGIVDAETRRSINDDLEPVAAEARRTIAEVNSRRSRVIEGRTPRLPCRIVCPRRSCRAINVVVVPPAPSDDHLPEPATVG